MKEYGIELEDVVPRDFATFFNCQLSTRKIELSLACRHGELPTGPKDNAVF